MAVNIEPTHICVMKDKIENLIQSMEEHAERTEKNMEKVSAAIQKHNEAIYGNGSPGIKTRLTILENAEAGRSRYIYLIWSSFIAAMIPVIIKVMTYVHHLGGEK